MSALFPWRARSPSGASSSGGSPSSEPDRAGAHLAWLFFTGDEQRASYAFSAGWHPLCDLTARRVPGTADLIREYFGAFEARDRPRFERLLDPDFSFSSPRDQRIDQRVFFERCWPNAGKLRAFRIERLCEQDGEVFVRYSAERAADGVRFRNTEHFRVTRGSIQSVDVYFGRDL